MSLVTLADMKTYLGEVTTTYDVFLQAQLDLYSSAVEGYCGRVFTSTSYTQTYYKDDLPQELRKLSLYHYPVTAIASISQITSFEGADTATTVLDAYDYRPNLNGGTILKLSSGVIIHWATDMGYDERIDVAYTAGYTTIPLEIDAVVKQLVETDYNKKISGVPLNLGPDVQSIAIAGVINIAYDYSLQANERKNKFGMLIGNYANVLDSFRSERALLGEVRENYVV